MREEVTTQLASKIWFTTNEDASAITVQTLHPTNHNSTRTVEKWNPQTTGHTPHAPAAD